MDLTPEQKQSVRQWAAEGCGLAEIQKRLASQFGLSPTYMDVRFLIIDMGITLREKAVSKASGFSALDKATAKPDTGGADLSAGDDGEAWSGPPSPVKVSVDRVTKAGTLVSGTVTFSDGVTAAWSLDQLGRLAVQPGKAGYTPKRADIQAFQEELRSVLERRGF